MVSAKKKRAQRQKQYMKNKDDAKVDMKEYYENNKSPIKLSQNEYYEQNKDAKKLSRKQHYEKNKDAEKLSRKQHYEKNKDAEKLSRKLHYEKNKERSKSYHKQYHREHKYSLISKMKQYNEHNSEGLAHKRKLLYGNIGHAKLVLKRARKYYARNRARICSNKRHRYNLSEPKPFAKHQYVLTAKKALLGDAVVMRKLIECFMSQQSSAYQDMTKRSRRTAIAQVAAHRLISKAMQLRKQHIGVLLKAVRNVCGLDIDEQCDFGESFGESLHSARSEPYYYESAYNFEHRPSVLVVDSCGRCRHGMLMSPNKGETIVSIVYPVVFHLEGRSPGISTHPPPQSSVSCPPKMFVI